MEKICEICQINESATKIYGWNLCQDCIQDWAEHLYKQRLNYCNWTGIFRPFFDNWRRKKLKRKRKRPKKFTPFERWDIMEFDD